MKYYIYHLSIAGLALGLIAGPQTLGADVGQPARKAPAAPSAEADIPTSVFNIPANPKEGRNPFFPQSKPTLVPSLKPVDPVDPMAFVLNGITSPPKRTAMINGRTFEPGEESEVKLPNGGKILVKCVEIRDDSAVILVAGQRRELRLRFGI